MYVSNSFNFILKLETRKEIFLHSVHFFFFFFPGYRNKRNTTPILTVKRSFTARNTGELPIEIYGFYINNLPCEGYGFKVLDCAPFRLNPNTTKRIEIAFTPDLTLSRVERKLQVLTSLGPDGDGGGGGEIIENGMVILNLLAILPAHLLHSCASVLARPSWEWAVHWAASCLSLILLPCVLVVSFLEADRILRGALANYLKEDPVQPPLDLRLLSNISMHNSTAQVSGDSGVVGKNEKSTTSDEKSPRTKKDEAFTPDWSLMNVKKCKDKDAQKPLLKIPDWTAEEERRFKLDTESKDLLSFKRCEEPSNVDGNVNAANTANTSTKKSKKQKQNAQETQSDNCMANDTLADTQLAQEKKCTVNAVTKSSPTSNRKGRAQSTQSPVKEETKLIDHEIQVDAGIINNSRASKSDNKRNNKQTNSGGNNNHVSLKKLDSTSASKIVHLSEEETSSTTTESSTHDETTSCKVSP